MEIPPGIFLLILLHMLLLLFLVFLLIFLNLTFVMVLLLLLILLLLLLLISRKKVESRAEEATNLGSSLLVLPLPSDNDGSSTKELEAIKCGEATRYLAPDF